MAPNINVDHQQIVPSLVLVKDNISRGGLQALLYKLMLLVGENMSQIQEAYANNQVDQDKIAQTQASVTEEQTATYVSKLGDQLASQQKWGPLEEFLKYFGAALSILVGAVTCGAAGFIAIGVTTAFLSSPAGEKATAELGSALAKKMGNSPEAKAWGKIIAQVVILVSVVVISGGAEAGSTLGDDTELSALKFTATKLNGLQTLGSTGLLGNVITQLIELIPGNKNGKETAETVLSIIANLAPMIASLFSAASAASDGTSVTEQIGKIFGSDEATLQQYANYAEIGGGFVLAGGSFADGSYKIDLSVDQTALAPLKGATSFGIGFFQILEKLANIAQKTVHSLMEGNETLFRTDFSADWRACVSAQYQG